MCGEATGLLVRGGQRPQVVLLKHGPGSCHTLNVLTSPEALARQPAPLFAFHSVQVGCQPVLPCKLRSKSASACACCCCTIKLPPVLPRALPTVKHHSAGRKRHRWPGRPQAAARWVCSGRQAVHSGDCWAQLGAVASPQLAVLLAHPSGFILSPVCTGFSPLQPRHLLMRAARPSWKDPAMSSAPMRTMWSVSQAAGDIGWLGRAVCPQAICQGDPPAAARLLNPPLSTRPLNRTLGNLYPLQAWA